MYFYIFLPYTPGITTHFSWHGNQWGKRLGDVHRRDTPNSPLPLLLKGLLIEAEAGQLSVHSVEQEKLARARSCK